MIISGGAIDRFLRIFFKNFKSKSWIFTKAFSRTLKAIIVELKEQFWKNKSLICKKNFHELGS